jgi:hypothetical protein
MTFRHASRVMAPRPKPLCSASCITGRLFAYLLGLKEPKVVLGYGGPEMDIAFI